MIGKIFLGKAWHWLLLVVTGSLFWFCGTKRLHVIEFNLFVAALIAGTAVGCGVDHIASQARRTDYAR